MAPVFDRVYNDAYKPLSENKISLETAAARAAEPLKAFMLRQTREKDLAMFAQMARAPEMQGPEEVPLSILVPAFVTSELKTAFQIGFTIFIPFLIIDLVVASVLMAMGMMMVPPATISLPFKLMLFFIPKLIALFATMVLAGPWMINTMVDYMREVFQSIPALAH
ncbi:flagellar biosynthetic protein FliP [compost metagenome]